MSEVTRILGGIQRGDAKAAGELLPLVYEELRRLAAIKMARETPGQTLQPTALVHEAWLRLTGNDAARWDGRTHFFSAAAEAMRRILVENARRKEALKRGGRAGRLELDLDQVAMATQAESGEVLALNEALEKLAAEDPSSAELIKLRFFVGMTNEEAAQALGISVRTAKRYWTFARAWLYNEMLERRETHTAGG